MGNDLPEVDASWVETDELVNEVEAEPVEVDELTAARVEAESHLNDLRRVAADFDNYRKRTQRELTSIIERSSERVVSSLLPVLDSLDSALAIETSTEAEEKLKAGVRGTRDQLLDLLEREGLEPIEAIDETFNPVLHEAVANNQEGEGPLVVLTQYRKGYLLKGKVLRASLVGVGHREA
ncbi:MAG: nucleotide exchange factor GrpE [Actinobacteria bacterium]|nr:nucleotide exchange factor GrpE [Actinomycetota bacterium]